MDKMATAIERLHQFSQSWNDDDVVDEASCLTGADLRMVLERLDATSQHDASSNAKPSTRGGLALQGIRHRPGSER